MNENPAILVVDDELSIRESFKLILSDKYSIITAASGEAAVKHAADDKIDLAFLDIRMPGLDGLETLKRMKEVNPDLVVIMVTAVNDVQKASEAIRLGAQDYIVKPFDMNQVIKLANENILKKRILNEGRRAGRFVEQAAFVGTSDKAEEIRKLAADALSRKGGVLILGPEGVEREAVARLLAPGIAIDLRSPHISLFGRSSGATVIDLKRAKGAMDLAAGGSIFIDHAELLSPWAQEKLLDYAAAAGGPGCRIYLGAASNLKETGFNGKLYENCSETIIDVPPLKERASDIPQILEHTLNEANLMYFREVKGFAPEAMSLLNAYPWPGNTAQLRSVVLNIVLLMDERPMIEVEDLPFEVLMNESSFSALPLEDMYSALEKLHILEVMKETGQDREKAAKILGIPEAVLAAKL